jgi:hypothetical protein
MRSPAARISGHRLADLSVLVVLAAAVVAYCIDAARASADTLNLILVLPVSVLVLVLCALQFALDVRDLREPPPARMAAADVVPVVMLFSAYVLTLPWLGFDVGTCLFLLAFLRLHGERRRLWLVAYAIGLSMALSLFFASTLPYRMPMLVLQVAGS